MASKEKSDIVYALADYKQLVIGYRTKNAQLVRQAAVWKTCVIWMGAVVFLIAVISAAAFMDYSARISSQRQDMSNLENEARDLSMRLEDTQRQLQKTRFDLAQKEEAVKQLEKKASTASRKLLEKLLKDQEQR